MFECCVFKCSMFAKLSATVCGCFLLKRASQWEFSDQYSCWQIDLRSCLLSNFHLASTWRNICCSWVAVYHWLFSTVAWSGKHFCILFDCIDSSSQFWWRNLFKHCGVSSICLSYCIRSVLIQAQEKYVFFLKHVGLSGKTEGSCSSCFRYIGCSSCSHSSIISH